MRHEPFPHAGNPERVVLLHDFSEALGGASYLVQVLIAHLRERGVPVTFFAGDAGANFHRDDVEFVPLHGKALLDRSKIGAFSAGFYNHAAFSRVREWIRANDTPRTAYHLHGWSKVLTPAVFAALQPVRGRLILHGHDYFNGCPNGAFFNYRTERECSLTPLSKACLRSRCDKASHAHKLWRSGREGVRRWFAGGLDCAARMLLIHPGQEKHFLAGQWPAEKLVAVRNPVSPPCSERVHAETNRGVVFIGRISAEKGADLAAQAADLAGVRITFVGEGSEAASVRRLNPGAIFLGRQDRAGVTHALSKARIAVMPSRWSEPFGLVALEAIGSGVPVILSERSLIADEVQRAGFGVAMNTANVSAFAACMSDLHANDGRVAAMSLAGHAGYRELCNTEQGWGDAIISQYRQVIAGAYTQPVAGASREPAR